MLAEAQGSTCTREAQQQNLAKAVHAALFAAHGGGAAATSKAGSPEAKVQPVGEDEGTSSWSTTCPATTTTLIPPSCNESGESGDSDAGHVPVTATVIDDVSSQSRQRRRDLFLSVALTQSSARSVAESIPPTPSVIQSSAQSTVASLPTPSVDRPPVASEEEEEEEEDQDWRPSFYVRKTTTLLSKDSCEDVVCGCASPVRVSIANESRHEALRAFLVSNGFDPAGGAMGSRRRMMLITYPLHVAAEHGNAGMTQLLLDEGADTRQKDSLGRTAASIALRRNNKAGSHEAVLRILTAAHDMRRSR